MESTYGLRTEWQAACRRTRQATVSHRRWTEWSEGSFSTRRWSSRSASSWSGRVPAAQHNPLRPRRRRRPRTPTGTESSPGSTDIKPLTPLIKQVKLVEDFERVLTWGAGLDHLACPKVLELAGPFRVVLDFPTPP